jgi:uncharacterized protein DUF4177
MDADPLGNQWIKKEENMKISDRKNGTILFFILATFLLTMILSQRVESARRYEYHVIAVTGMNQLRTQSDAEQGRVKAIEDVVNEQAAQGWELFQADGYILYFRR